MSIGNTSHAQEYRRLREYSTDDGLSINSVSKLMFDKRGFLWVATPDGLQRFDGYNFRTFKNDKGKASSMPENFILSLYEDEAENIWVTHRIGVSVKPKGLLSFKHIGENKTNFSWKLPHYCVAESDSSVFLLNYPDEVLEVNKFTYAITKKIPYHRPNDEEELICLTQLKNSHGQSWFTDLNKNNGALIRFISGNITRYKNDDGIKVHFIIPKGKDSIVVVAQDLTYVAASVAPFVPVRKLNTAITEADFGYGLHTWPREIANEKYLLIGVNRTWLYDANADTVGPASMAQYFPDKDWQYFDGSTFDQRGNTWFNYGGVTGIKVFSRQKFGLFDRPDSSKMPYCLLAGLNGNVYLGTYLGNIEVYNNKGHYLYSYNVKKNDPRFESARAIDFMDSNTLVVKSVFEKICIIDVTTHQITHYSHLMPHLNNTIEGLDFEPAMQHISDNEVWFSHGNTLLSCKRINGKISITPFCTLPEKGRITSLCYQQGKLWIGTIFGCWMWENNVLKRLSMPVSYTKHVNLHPNGNLWVTSTDGIFIFKNNMLIKRIGSAEGLPNSFVYGILFDNQQSAWASTNKGLAKIDTGYHITSYTSGEGLQDNEFNTRCYTKSRDGILYFGGIHGVNYFSAETVVNKSAASVTRLSGIEVNNEVYLPAVEPDFIDHISLGYKQNNIRLTFSCMDFTVPEKNQFKFWLKGFQDDWSAPQQSNTVQYILPPGEYNLYVLSANYEGVWNKEPLIVKISILPPWYQSNAARIIFLLLLIAGVGSAFYFISKYRYQKKLRQLQMQQDVQREKERLSRDLHDNLGSQLTWMSNNISQLEDAIKRKEDHSQRIQRLKEGSGNLMQTLRETIWILNKDNISTEELSDKIVSFAARHVEAYPPLQLNTEENLSHSATISSLQALQVFRICQEAIHNACKYASASALTLVLETKENGLCIAINDNGIGFDPNAVDAAGHYGIQNMRQRAEESGIQLMIESVMGSGTSVSLFISFSDHHV